MSTGAWHQQLEQRQQQQRGWKSAKAACRTTCAEQLHCVLSAVVRSAATAAKQDLSCSGRRHMPGAACLFILFVWQPPCAAWHAVAQRAPR